MRKYFIEDWKGKQVNELTITGKLKKVPGRKTNWECLCSCGSLIYVDPSRICKGETKTCRPCYYISTRGSKSANYTGSEHIPGRVLSSLTKGAKRRSKDIPVSIDIQDLEDQWIEQDGRCAYTGLSLTYSSVKRKGDASVDRIDSSVGYTRDNIQFVHKRINIMKNDMDEAEFLLMCKLVAEVS